MESVRTPVRASLVLAVVLSAPLAGCGSGSGSRDENLGTVAIRNETDQGMAPLTVTAFFFRPVGVADPGPDLLTETVAPGAIVIVGLFPPGLYNAEAMLSNGGSLVFMDVAVKAGAPTNVVIPVL